jgi:hypothetical protein
MTGRTYSGREEIAWEARNRHARALAMYVVALAEFEEAQADLAARLLAGEDTTPEQELRDSTARQNLDNARTLVWSFPLV